MVDRSRHSPVFIDYSGKRWRHIRRAALVVGVITTVLALVLIGSLVLSPSMPPELPLATANNRVIARATMASPAPSPRWTGCARRIAASWRRP